MKNWGKQIFLVLAIAAILIVQTNFISATPEINIDIDDTNIDLGEYIEITININSENKSMTSIEIDYDDGNIKTYTPSNPNVFSMIKEYKYDDSGSYDIEIIVTADGETFSGTSSNIDVEEVEVQDDHPEVSLLSPSKNKLLKADSVDFKFTATDDFKLSLCSFELYKKDGSFKELEYESEINNPESGSEMTVKLKEFEDGNYTWYVECKDNRSQKTTKSRSFSIQTTNHERQKEIEQLLVDIDDFMKKEDSLTFEEKDAVSELKISEDLRYYKKRLMQINQDLGSNIKIISDSTLREKRKIETIEELDEIKEKIPKNIEIIKNDEYIKNSLTSPLEEIIGEYTTGKKIILSQRKIRRLSKLNSEIQESITTSTNIKKILISYENKDREITIVKKEIKISDSSLKKILEVFPNEFNEEIVFITKVGKVSNNIYEVNLNDLNKNEILYYIEKNINLNKIKDTETILFEEFSTSGNFITGFAVSSSISSSSYLVFGIVIIFVVLGIIFIKKRPNYSKHKNKKEIVEIISLIKYSAKKIKEKDFDLAKEKYHRIQSLYSSISTEAKNSLFNEIEKIRIEIDKDEMKNLIKEYEKAKKENDAKTSHAIYNKIKTKYLRLPKENQSKVYDWITNKF